MAKVQTIRRRIKSVKNINQITKAMEMVAASKLRRAQEATLKSRTYAQSARELLALLRSQATEETHPLFRTREGKRRLIILFSSDRGLAGAYNSNLFKALVMLLQQSPNQTTQMIVVGNKGAQFVSRLASQVDVVGVYTNWPAKPSITDIMPIAKTVTENFISGSVDEVTVLYTDFVSVTAQVVTPRRLLPINPAEILSSEKKINPTVTPILFEPSPTAVMDYVVPRVIEVLIYQAALEAAASEQSMRMVAMKSASDNAKDIIGDLTLTYNGARQAAITQELAEITSGAEAMK